MANYKHADTNQSQIVVLNFGELFPEDHHVRRLLDVIQQLDLSQFDSNYLNGTAKGGRKAFPVDRLLAILIYSLLHGNISMRNLERDLSQRADLLFLSGGLTLDHTTISVFRKRHTEAIENLFTQTVFLGSEAGLIDFDSVCIDSTKIKASANCRDIGTKEQHLKRYSHIREACKKRYEEWESASAEADKEALAKKLERLRKQQEKITRGIEFLKENEDRKRIHLTDQDADWHKNRSGGFVVGYNAHVAVDSKTNMIVHQKVVTNQADNTETLAMVEGVEQIKEAIVSEKADDSASNSKEPPQSNYILDSGYSSNKNLEALKDKDVYMPDQGFASKTKPEDRQDKQEKEKRREEEMSKSELEFTYEPETDTFTCPANKKLNFKTERSIRGTTYRIYRKFDCDSCSMKGQCISSKATKKEITVASHNYEALKKEKIKRVRPYGSNRGGLKKITNPLALKMREKLKSSEGRQVYSLRFPIAEGSIGVIKAIRNGREFLRRGLNRVQIEWIERCIAHNIAKMMEFTRV